MFRDLPLLVILILGGAVVVTLVSRVQPLTNSGESSSRSLNQIEYQAEYDKELKFCRSQPDGRNCKCAAKISGSIVADNEPRVRGAIYVDRTDLARGQAKSIC